jgi:hypothetical protein
VACVEERVVGVPAGREIALRRAGASVEHQSGRQYALQDVRALSPARVCSILHAGARLASSGFMRAPGQRRLAVQDPLRSASLGREELAIGEGRLMGRQQTTFAEERPTDAGEALMPLKHC